MVGILEEHLEYLSTEGRHALFARALDQVVQLGDVVADLGCGFGVLGLQSLAAGADRVFGIDQTAAIEIARETARRSGLEDHYTCLHSSTFKAELPEKADVLVCDHVGYFGIDYGIIAMLQDARQRMLKPDGAVVPQHLDLNVAAVSSKACHDLATAWSRAPVPAEYAWLDSYATNSRHEFEFAPDDLCSAPARIGGVRLDEDNPDLLEFNSELVIAQPGMMHGIAGWFDCELAEGVWMTNSPLEEDAINRSQAFFPLAKPLDVEAGNRIGVSMRIDHKAQLFTWTIQPGNGGEAQTMSTWKSTILSPADLAKGAE